MGESKFLGSTNNCHEKSLENQKKYWLISGVLSPVVIGTVC